jgi:hypothetical protein
MAVLRGEQARQAYARAQHQRERTFPPQHEEPDRHGDAAPASPWLARSSVRLDVSARARRARRWTIQNSSQRDLSSA